MNHLDKEIKRILKTEINRSSGFDRAIETAFERNKNRSFNMKRVLATTGVITLALTGMVFATVVTYEKIWKNPEVIDIEKEKPSIVSEMEKEEAIQESEIIHKASQILKSLGYPEKEIKNIELKRSYDDNSKNYYEVRTETEYSKGKKNIGIYMNFNGQTGALEYFINNDFEEIEPKLQKMDDEQVEVMINEKLKALNYDLGRYKLEIRRQEGNAYVVAFSREYNGIYNRYDELQIAFGKTSDGMIVHSISGIINENFENNPFVITEQEAIEIAKKKENEFSDIAIKNITVTKSIEKMNTFIYQVENNIEDESSLKIPNTIRNVWCVKIAHIENEDIVNEKSKTKDDIERFKKYEDKIYYIDGTTGEIIGGNQAKFNIDE